MKVTGKEILEKAEKAQKVQLFSPELQTYFTVRKSELKKTLATIDSGEYEVSLSWSDWATTLKINPVRG